MLKTKFQSEEDQPLLLLEESSNNIDGLPLTSYENAITRGAVNYLARWPSHLFVAFITGCFIFATLTIFILVTTVFLVPADDRCRYEPFPHQITKYQPNRRMKNMEIGEVPNVYFVKHENRTWSKKELCYIETAARAHSELNVYLINLLTEDPNEERISELVIRLMNVRKERRSLIGTMDLLGQINDSLISTNVTPEAQLRKKLAWKNSNIRNIDVAVDRFFNGSSLSNVCKNLDPQMVEMAARAYVLWNFPGVALDPAMYSSLNQMHQFICSNSRETCEPNQVATIEPKGDLQASAVPCQVFMGFLIREIAKNGLSDQEYTLKQALNDFCPRSQHCPGVKVLNLSPESSSLNEKNLHCPTIYPEGPSLDLIGPSNKILNFGLG